MNTETITAARELLPSGHVYADWAASALPLPFSHPSRFIPPHHSNSQSLDAARRAIRSFVNDSCEEYHIVFTSGTTASFQLLADRLPWSQKATFFHHAHVHNSLLGMRNVAKKNGGSVRCFKSEGVGVHIGDASENGLCSDRESDVSSSNQDATSFALFAYPAECNLSGTTYPLSWACRVKEHGVDQYPASQVITLLDTAKYLASTPFSLVDHPYIDALVFSLYKLSASYTGLGALLIRRDSLLERLIIDSAGVSYFAGGESFQVASPFSDTLFIPSTNVERLLQLGTPNLQAIDHLPAQLSHFPRATMVKIHHHTAQLARSFIAQLCASFPVSRVKIHEDKYVPRTESASGIVSFTIYRDNCLPIGHNEVMTILDVNNIHARGGCMCNIGACASVLNLSDADMMKNYEMGHRCGDGMDFAGGRPTGVVRISFGWASVVADIERIVSVLRTYLPISVTRPLKRVALSDEFEIERLFVYPVKSCGGFEVRKFECDRRGGIVGDRVFGVEDIATGRILDVKACPSLVGIIARYEDEYHRLVIRYVGDFSQAEEDNPRTVVYLSDYAPVQDFQQLSTRDVGLQEGMKPPCNYLSRTQTRKIVVGGEAVSEFLSRHLERRVQLVRILTPSERQCGKRNALIVTIHETEALKSLSDIPTTEAIHVCTRPNVVLRMLYNSAYENIEEMQIPVASDFELFIGEQCEFRFQRRCTRCKVVNYISEQRGLTSEGEPLRSIAKLCTSSGRKGLVFGTLHSIHTPDMQRGWLTKGERLSGWLREHSTNKSGQSDARLQRSAANDTTRSR